MDRLDYLIHLVESGSSSSTRSQDNISVPESLLASSCHDLRSQAQDISWDTEDTNAVRDDLTKANNGRTSSQTKIDFCEDMLEWPIFQGRYDRTKIEALIFDPTLDWQNHGGITSISEDASDAPYSNSQDPRSSLGTGRGVQEEDVIPLIDSFLMNVHVKNPIIDPNFLQRTAKSVATTGFGWDARSCLVVRLLTSGSMLR